MTTEPEDPARRVPTTTLRLLQGGRDGGHSGGMPPSFDEAKTFWMNVDVKVLIRDISEIKAKVSRMPTTFQMLAWFVGVSMGLVALVFMIALAIK